MKIKGDFVTNSSSTAFFFIFKGKDIHDLVSILRKYPEYFKSKTNDFRGKTLTINVEDVINDILSLEKNEDFSYQHMSCPVKLRKQMKLQISEYGYDSSYSEFIEQHIKSLEEAFKLGMRRCIEITWGDNEGDITGGPTGYCMDYVLGRLKVAKKDLIIFTESHH